MGPHKPKDPRTFAVINIRTSQTSSASSSSSSGSSRNISRSFQYAHSLSTLSTGCTMVTAQPVRTAPAINPLASARQASNPFDAGQPSTRASPTTMMVMYASEGRWQRITFPPNVTVGQARDLCMLRFSVWQNLVRDTAQSVHSSSSNAESLGNVSSTSSESVREQFGLYWAARGLWLENSRLLSSYGFETADVLELQDREDIVLQQVEAPAAEGLIYHLQNKGVGAAWKLKYLVLRNQMLYVCRRKGDDISMAQVEVDLTHKFRIIDQNGQASREAATSDRLPDASAEMALGLASAHGRQMGGDGAPLLVLSGKKVHVFCTQSLVDYDYWRRALRQAAGSRGSSRRSSMPSGGPRHPRTPSLASTTVSSSSPTMSALRRFISTAYRKRAGIGLQLCHCAVVPGALYGFCGQDPTGLSDGQLEGTADFRIVLDPMTVFVAGERHGDRFIVRLFDVSELLWLEVGTQTQRDRWLSALCGIGGISQTDYFDLEGICNGTAADQDLSLRRSRSFVSTISRAEWPMPPSIIPVSLSSMGPTLRGWRPRDKNMVKQHLARAEKTAGSKPSLDAVGGQADEPEGLLSRLPQWFKRRGSLSS